MMHNKMLWPGTCRQEQRNEHEIKKDHGEKENGDCPLTCIRIRDKITANM
jgi:hypothetical protein